MREQGGVWGGEDITFRECGLVEIEISKIRLILAPNLNTYWLLVRRVKPRCLIGGKCTTADTSGCHNVYPRRNFPPSIAAPLFLQRFCATVFGH